MSECCYFSVRVASKLFSQPVKSGCGNGSTQGLLIMSLIFIIPMFPRSLQLLLFLPSLFSSSIVSLHFGTARHLALIIAGFLFSHGVSSLHAGFGLCQEQLLCDLAELMADWVFVVFSKCIWCACFPPSLSSCCSLARPVRDQCCLVDGITKWANVAAKIGNWRPC